jgi:peroxiredoxin
MLQRLFQGKKGLLILMAVTLLLTPLHGWALEIGAPPPDFELPGIKGDTVRLSAFRGRPIVLKIATTWCPSCKVQVKELALAQDVLKAYNAAVIEVYIDEPLQDVVNDVQTRPTALASVVAVDDGQVARKYNLLGIPRVLVIDRDFLVQRDRGLLTADDLAAKLKSLDR